jgi:thioredoxin-like negative regulator of GroEL
MPTSAAGAWFASVKPYCNPLEVEVHLRRSPAPGGRDAAGFAAACWAVAGKIDRARATIDALPVEDRQHAANIVFGIGHPIADMGDDLSAGPIMELVVEYQPQNYMALYHAGMSYHALGRSEHAKRHLTEFLRLYNVNDGWKTSAEDVLRRLGEKR